MLNKDWAYYNDASGEFSQGSIDLATDANGEVGYFWSSSTSLFFRMALRETPGGGPGGLVQYAWFIAIDVDLDTYIDWCVMLGGITEGLYSFANTTGYPDNTPDATANYTQPADPKVGPSPLTSGYARIVSAGYPANPNMVYLDIQIPYSALTKTGYSKNISYTTPFRMFYSTSTTETASIKDAIGTSTTISGAFADATSYTPSTPQSYGRIYDTRDPAPYSSAGIWYRNETVTVSGLSWPPSTSSYYNSGHRNVQVVNSSNNIIWSGVVTTTAAGDLVNFPMWTVDLTILPDIYTIKVEDPRTPGSYLAYDSFEIKAPIISVTKTTSTPTVSTGSNIIYSIQIQNTGNVAGTLTSIVDNLPTSFSFVAGSTTGLTTANPTINGNQISWLGTWSIPASGSVTLNFVAKAGLIRGSFTNDASVGGGNFAVKSTGSTAAVQVTGPVLSLSKSVNKSSAIPADTLLYTVSYFNTGDGEAAYIFILESIPANTVYVPLSATGSGTTITYSHDGGITYDASQTAPVTNLSFQRTTSLSPGSSSSVSFKVKVK